MVNYGGSWVAVSDQSHAFLRSGSTASRFWWTWSAPLLTALHNDKDDDMSFFCLASWIRRQICWIQVVKRKKLWPHQKAKIPKSTLNWHQRDSHFTWIFHIYQMCPFLKKKNCWAEEKCLFCSWRDLSFSHNYPNRAAMIYTDRQAVVHAKVKKINR